VFSTVLPDFNGKIAIGSGVQLEDVQRIRNQIIDKQVWDYKQSYASANKQASTLAYIESLFSEPGEHGISTLMNNFFNAWDDLSVDPTSSPLRTNLVYTAQNLSVKVQNVYDGLSEIKSDLKKDSQSLVDDLNTYISELRYVNKQIYEARVVNNSANDLFDKRDELLGKMSNIANLNVFIDEWGVANVSIGGIFAVDRLSEVKFKITEGNEGKIYVETEDGNSRMALRSGELFANSRVVNELIPEYQNSIDEIFNSLVYNVNKVHNSGFTITDPPVDSIDFFEGYSDGILKINTDIINDPNKIAISADGTSGNNEIALQISKLQDEQLLNGISFADNYSNLISSIATEKQYQDESAETFELVLNNLEQQVSSISGVSVDEEMVDILKYQRSYDASAKLISIADEMIKTILQMV
jgi:flagellar hook-associated protein 1 FlgK